VYCEIFGFNRWESTRVFISFTFIYFTNVVGYVKRVVVAVKSVSSYVAYVPVLLKK